ncbi:unnamed protein product [Lepeophtheirus salmonis]|uniref:(salmon louse) hypothetical protein n=1 Tax=Lepeophtheirus salmonis TaxID=72036 RepID=A0A7R8HCZ8_LEPSM|nr:unnamed protein product [Lepeophtheirus salmonis]CAF3016536.1 unnamed protein product [Lepeophtheirus salmonis]
MRLLSVRSVPSDAFSTSRNPSSYYFHQVPLLQKVIARLRSLTASRPSIIITFHRRGTRWFLDLISLSRDSIDVGHCSKVLRDPRSQRPSDILLGTLRAGYSQPARHYNK